MLPHTKTVRIWKTVLFAVVDWVSLVSGMTLAYLLRFRWLAENFEEVRKLTALQYFGLISGLAFLTLVFYAILGLYEVNQRQGIVKKFLKISLGWFLVLSIFASGLFFFEFNVRVFPDGILVSRFVLLVGGVIGFAALIAGRILVWFILRLMMSLGLGKSNVILIGEDLELEQKLSANPSVNSILGYKDLDLEVLGILQGKIINREVDEIYLISSKNNAISARLGLLAERYKVNFIFSPEGFSHFQFFGLQPITIGSKLYLEVIHSNLNGWLVVLKRLFDILFASIFLTVFLPIYILIYILIKLEDGGPALYFSQRVGPDGKQFALWKFRRLQAKFCTTENNQAALEIEKKLIETSDTRGDGILYKISDDPRSTKVGKFIERTSLDELPQFINVLIGNMSVVGPRPHQPREVAKYQSEHYKVLNIKPGITGFAQINGRSDLAFEREVELDCFYIEHWSFWMDLKIIIMTPPVLLKRHKS